MAQSDYQRTHEFGVIGRVDAAGIKPMELPIILKTVEYSRMIGTFPVGGFNVEVMWGAPTPEGTDILIGVNDMKQPTSLGQTSIDRVTANIGRKLTEGLMSLETSKPFDYQMSTSQTRPGIKPELAFSIDPGLNCAWKKGQPLVDLADTDIVAIFEHMAANTNREELLKAPPRQDKAR